MTETETETEIQEKQGTKTRQSEFQPAKFKDHIEVLGRGLLGVTAFCYVLGILVESLYLGSFGIYHINLFRFTYVFAGLWAIFIFALPMLPVLILFGVWQFYKSVGGWNSVGGIRTIIGWLLGAFLAVAPTGLLVFLLISIGIKVNSLLFPSIQTVAVFIFGFLSYSVFFTTQNRNYLHSKILFPIFTVIFFLFFIGIFSAVIFPQISSRFGGGKPLTVQLLLEANKQNASMIRRNFDLCENAETRIAAPEDIWLVATKPMPLLLATDSDYIIRKDENTAISISREQVKTVLYLNNVGSNTDVCAAPEPPVTPPPIE